MVFAFFRKAEPVLQSVETRAVAMLYDARHSFDLASLALLGGASSESVGADIRKTDERINKAEQDIRSELVVHVSVQGGHDIAAVMSYTLLIKKIERIGDQAKNILDLAEEGVSLAEGDDLDRLLEERTLVSGLFVETVELLVADDEPGIDEFAQRVQALAAEQNERIHELTHSDLPGRVAVPRAIYYRYLKRIVANLVGIVTTATEPLHHVDYLDEGETDITDD